MRVTIDLMKKSTQIIDLSNVINPRVGDDDLLLPLHICYGDNLYDMRENDVEFLTQDTNKNNIYIAGTCNTNTPGDNLYTGDLTFRFPAGTFKVDGTYDPDQTMFRIVDKATQKVISSVNVKITVMKNAIEFNFDPNQSSYDSRAETMLQDFHDKGQAMLDEITGLNNQAKSNVSGDTAATANAAKQQADQNAGDISDLEGEVAGARGRFADLPGREDAQDTAISQKENIVNANANYAALQQKDAQQDAEIASKAGKFELENKLAQMHVEPEGFKNLDDLKAKYPNGNSNLNVTVDNGHLLIWLNNAWNDCGQFQTAGIDQALVDQIKEIFEQLNVLPELIDGQPTPNQSAVISPTKYLGQDWMQMTSTTNTPYRGLTLWIDNPDKISEMANYPVKIHFNIQSSIDQTFILKLEFYDTNGVLLSSKDYIDNIALKASEILNYQKELSFTSNDIKNVTEIRILLYTSGTDDLGTVLINNYSAVLEYKQIPARDYNQLPELIDGQPSPNNGDTVISTTKYLDQDWLQITSTANTQYRGVNFWIDDLDKISEMANYPVKINFNIQSSIDQTLALDIHFYDGDGQDITNNHVYFDNIALKAYEILNYQKEISLNSVNLKGASKVALLLTTLGTNDLGTILINNYSAVLEYKQMPAEMSGTNASDKLESYYNLPIIKINGELAGMNQDNAKQVTYEYRNGNTVLTGSAKIKWQGNSSTAWDKKGYRLQPFTDNTFTKKEEVQFIPSWSPTSKINLKAYYTDGLLSRDVVNANIGADIASTNFSLPDDLKNEDNFGFIDGFPIVLIINDEFEGIYSFNTARSDFDYVKYGIMGNGYTNVTYFTSTNKTDVKLDGSDFESLNPETVTDDEKSAVGDLVTWVATSSDENFKADFEKHLDLKTTIDYFILCNLLASTDSFVKNQIFLSWDGVKWFMQAYDLDCTLGISWEGKAQDLPTKLIGTDNKLFSRLAQLFNSEISARYTELRAWLAPAYVLKKYKEHINEIGVGNYKLEFAKWNNPSKDIATYKQLKDAVLHQFSLLDQIWLNK